MHLLRHFWEALVVGKSMSVNLLSTLATVYGAKTLIIDPKSERGQWKEKLEPLGLDINIVELENDEDNRGMLDPFVILRRAKDAESLAMDLLTYLPECQLVRESDSRNCAKLYAGLETGAA